MCAVIVSRKIDTIYTAALKMLPIFGPIPKLTRSVCDSFSRVFFMYYFSRSFILFQTKHSRGKGLKESRKLKSVIFGLIDRGYRYINILAHEMDFKDNCSP